MSYQIDIAKLLRLAHGVEPSYFVRQGSPVGESNSYDAGNARKGISPNNSYQANALRKEESELHAILGDSIISPFAIQAFEYNQQNGSEFSLQNFEGYRFPAATMVSVSMRKNILKTKVQGRAGTVKEMIADGDFQLRIEGVILDTDDTSYPLKPTIGKVQSSQYPQQQMEAMAAVLKIPASLPIQNDFLNSLGIYHIVITSYRFAASNEFENAQLFSITALSDHIFDVRTLNEPFDPNL